MGYGRRNFRPRLRSRSRYQAAFSASVCRWRSSRTRLVGTRTAYVTPPPARPPRGPPPAPVGEGWEISILLRSPQPSPLGKRRTIPPPYPLPTPYPWAGRGDPIPDSYSPTLSRGERVAALCRQVRGLLLPARRGL